MEDSPGQLTWAWERGRDTAVKISSDLLIHWSGSSVTGPNWLVLNQNVGFLV